MRHRALWLSLLALSAGCSADPIAIDAGVDAGAIDAGPADAAIDVDAAPDAGPPDAGDPLVRCDEEGELCCLGATCGAGLSCVDGVCTTAGCGAIGAPCCELNQCDPGAMCDSGTCVEAPCGGFLAACCATDPMCGDGLDCLGGTCQPCGGSGEACCPGDVCDEGLDCLPNLFGGMDCVAPPTCGELGNPCCESDAPCGDGLGCTSIDPSTPPVCLPGPICGDEARACCATDPQCGPGLQCRASAGDVERCQRCGEYELPCCEGSAAPCGPGLSCTIDGICELPL